jgi:hypothetical protein
MPSTSLAAMAATDKALDTWTPGALEASWATEV